MTENPNNPLDARGWDGMNGRMAKRSRLGSLIIIAVVLLAGAIPGGLTTRSVALSEPILKGGVRVSLSSAGQAIFFAIGSVSGMLIPSLICLLCFLVDDGKSLGKWRETWRVVCLAMLASVSSVVAGIMVFVGLGFIFITIPREVFDFLTN
jgi:hypothetical protein